MIRTAHCPKYVRTSGSKFGSTASCAAAAAGQSVRVKPAKPFHSMSDSFVIDSLSHFHVKFSSGRNLFENQKYIN